jgi:hypothetical protein
MLLHATLGAGRGAPSLPPSLFSFCLTLEKLDGISIGSRPMARGGGARTGGRAGAPRRRDRQGARIVFFLGGRGGGEKGNDGRVFFPSNDKHSLTHRVSLSSQLRATAFTVPLSVARTHWPAKTPDRIMRPVRATAAAGAAPASTPFRPAKPTLFSVPVSNKAAQVCVCVCVCVCVRERGRAWGGDPFSLCVEGDDQNPLPPSFSRSPPRSATSSTPKAWRTKSTSPPPPSWAA